MPLSNGLDSRLRGNDGIGLPLQHGFFRFYVLDSRLRGNDGIGLLFSDGISAQSSSASTNARASNGRRSSMPSPTPI
ncbi:hypothetical protein COH71_09260 [Neisseria meningitidis]|nr:hypothetical protein COH71_09260 [Neisseria meningitidis]RQK45439.1 hypothetical protein COH67_03665 [Neisseria meningitidis]